MARTKASTTATTKLPTNREPHGAPTVSWQSRAEALAQSLSKPSTPPNAHTTIRADIDDLIRLVEREGDVEQAEALLERLSSMESLPHGDLVRCALEHGRRDELERIIDPVEMGQYPMLG